MNQIIEDLEFKDWSHIENINLFDIDKESIEQRTFRMIEKGEKIHSRYNCNTVRGLDVVPGLFLICLNGFYIIDNYHLTKKNIIEFVESPIENSEINQVKLTHKKRYILNCQKWLYDGINEMCLRRYCLQQIAIEFFHKDGNSSFVCFEKNQRNSIFKIIKNNMEKVQSIHSISNGHIFSSNLNSSPVLKNSFIHFSALNSKFQKKSKISKFNFSNLTKLWQNNLVSNFQYLMFLNTIAGRTYHDLSQYPVFPWVLKDYDSEFLDLKDPNVYRDLSKTMGALDPKRAKLFRKRYKNWRDPITKIPAFHYGTHYSSAGSVLYYLVRLEPFTKQHVQLQGGKFDHPDRIFYSIPHCYKTASSGAFLSDVKELTPEFYYLPEFLINQNKLEFGKTGNEVPRNKNVELPKWANGSAFEFIRIHRQALESDYVSRNLHHWIDLIFGYKQQGEEAVKALNVFYYLTYENSFNLEAITNKTERESMIAQINNFGQTPKQLFFSKHPSKMIFIKDPTICSHTKYLDFEILNGLKNMAIGSITIFNDKLKIAPQCKLFYPSLAKPEKYISWDYPDNSLRMVDDDGSILMVSERGHSSNITDVCLSTDNKILVTGDTEGILIFWEILQITQKKLLKIKIKKKKTSIYSFLLIDRLIGHTKKINCIAISQIYNIIVSGGEDKNCLIWDTQSKQLIRSIQLDHPISKITINQISGEIFICSANFLNLYTINGCFIASCEIDLKFPHKITSLEITKSPNYDQDIRYLSGDSTGMVVFWKLDQLIPNKKRSLSIFSRKHVSKSPITSMHVTWDNKYIYCGDSKGGLRKLKLLPNDKIENISTENKN